MGPSTVREIECVEQSDLADLPVWGVGERVHEHDIHQTFFAEHFVQKGAEAAIACAKTLEGLQRVTQAA